jgi:hypothetical protein
MLLEHERPLVQFLFDLANKEVEFDELRVEPMDDGGMGSLRIGPIYKGRRFGFCPAECHFYDLDGTLISATLNLDQTGAPFEIDVWRVDFRPTRRWPLTAELRAGSPDNSPTATP